MKKSKTKALIFLRRNAVYLVLSLCILAVGLSIVFMQISYIFLCFMIFFAKKTARAEM